jgi:hypothetical protein
MTDARIRERAAIYKALNARFKNPPADKEGWNAHLDAIMLNFAGVYIHEARPALNAFLDAKNHGHLLEPQFDTLLPGKENKTLPSAVIAYIPNADDDTHATGTYLFDHYITTKSINDATWDARFAKMKKHHADGAIVWDEKHISAGYVMLRPPPEQLKQAAHAIAGNNPKTIREATDPFIPYELQGNDTEGHQGGKISAGVEISLAVADSDVIIMRQTVKNKGVGTMLRCKKGLSDIIYVDTPQFGNPEPDQLFIPEHNIVIVHAHYEFSPEESRIGEPRYNYLKPHDLGLIVE